MAGASLICPVCGETSAVGAGGESSAVSCPRCGSSFAPGDATVVDSDLAHQSFVQTVRLPTPVPLNIPPAPSAASLPDIPGYEVLRFVARGGMGFVLKARHRVLDRLAAVKIPLPHLLADPGSRERFLREARAAAHLRHPNICPIYEVGEAPDRPFIAMAFIEGENLRDWAKSQKPTPHRAAEVVAALARGVSYAHEHGIIHRDIKPANVLVDAESGQPVLTDFGLAKELAERSGEMTEWGTVVGTPAYMAPEQAAGRLDAIGPRTDVYGLGSVLYELLCGSPPFLGSRSSILLHVQTQEPDPPRKRNPRIHRDLETVCLKALAKDPADRYASALELAADLERFCAGDAILARREGMAARLVRKVRRNRFPAASAAAVILLAVVAAYFALRVSGSSRVAALAQAFETELEAADWTPGHLATMDGLIERIERVAPSRGALARQRLNQRFTESIRESLRRPALASEDIAQAQSQIALLESRAADEAPALRQALAERLRAWQPLFDLRAPFQELGKIFDPALVEIDKGQALARAGAADAVNPFLLSRVRCEGNVQVEALLPASWQEAYKLGLVLQGAPRGKGYVFLLRAPQPEPAGAEPPQKLSFKAARDAGGMLSLQLLRHGVLLRSKDIAAARIAPGPLHLSASREGTRLSFQAGSLPPVVFEDVLAISGAETGVFGLYWPAGVRIERLWASRQARPAVLSPLERGDELYAREQFAEALAFYRQQAISTSVSEFREEARYKEGLCLVGLRRDEEAAAVYEQLAASAGAHWPPLAACQLWLLRVRQQRVADADAVFESLAVRYRFEQLAALIPEGDRRQLSETYCRGGRGAGFLEFNPNRLRDLERAVAVRDLLDVDMGQFPERSLVRAYRVAGQTDKALAIAEKMVRDGFPYWSGGVAEEYAWMLREKGDVRRALAETNRLLFARGGVLSESFWWLLVERARSEIALGQWAEAEKDVEAFLREAATRSADYYNVSAARLIQGFLRERRGDSAGALEAWRSGFLKPTVPGQPKESYVEAINGAGALYHFFILGSLTAELTDADINRFIDKYAADVSEASPVALFKAIGLPKSVYVGFREMWRSPRGHDWARKVAYQDLSYADFVFTPPRLLLTTIVVLDAFQGKASADQESLIWQAVTDGLSAIIGGRMRATQFAQIALAWKGTTNFLGWAGVAPALEPRVRGPLAYALGHRYLRLGRPQDAATFFRAARTDAPPDSLLRRLAEAEIQRRPGP